MKNTVSIILLLTLIFCSTSIANLKQDNAHNSFNSLDWEGTYIGSYTGDDGKKIEKRITTSENLTYKITFINIGSEIPSDYILKGSFKWYNDGSCIALLINIPKLEPFKFKVGENTLISLNIDGEVTDNSVIYTKINL